MILTTAAESRSPSPGNEDEEYFIPNRKELEEKTIGTTSAMLARISNKSNSIAASSAGTMPGVSEESGVTLAPSSNLALPMKVRSASPNDDDDEDDDDDQNINTSGGGTSVHTGAQSLSLDAKWKLQKDRKGKIGLGAAVEALVDPEALQRKRGAILIKREMQYADPGHTHSHTLDDFMDDATENQVSAMRASIEVQQILVCFDEILQDLGSPERGPAKRPLMQYFHRSVEKVMASQRRIVAQDKCQQFIFNYVQDQEEIEPEEINRDALALDDILKREKYWDRVGGTHGFETASKPVEPKKKVFNSKSLEVRAGLKRAQLPESLVLMAEDTFDKTLFLGAGNRRTTARPTVVSQNLPSNSASSRRATVKELQALPSPSSPDKEASRTGRRATVSLKLDEEESTFEDAVVPEPEEPEQPSSTTDHQKGSSKESAWSGSWKVGLKLSDVVSKVGPHLKSRLEPLVDQNGFFQSKNSRPLEDRLEREFYEEVHEAALEKSFADGIDYDPNLKTRDGGASVGKIHRWMRQTPQSYSHMGCDEPFDARPEHPEALWKQRFTQQLQTRSIRPEWALKQPSSRPNLGTFYAAAGMSVPEVFTSNGLVTARPKIATCRPGAITLDPTKKLKGLTKKAMPKCKALRNFEEEDDEDEPLRDEASATRPPAKFPSEPHPLTQYVRGCENQGIMPLHTKFLSGVNPLEVKLHRQHLGDSHLAAFNKCIGSVGGDVQIIDISDNKLSDHAVNDFLEILTEPETNMNDSRSRVQSKNYLAKKNLRSEKRARPSTYKPAESISSNNATSNLMMLDLSGNNLGQRSLGTLAAALRAGTLCVQALNLNCIPIPPEAFRMLSTAIVGNGCCQRLGLADTSCGMHHQDACQSVASMSFTVRELDISHNYFREEGLGELAYHLSAKFCKVQKMSLAYNTWSTPLGRVKLEAPYLRGVAADDENFANSLAERSPMLIFCEKLRENRSLLHLDLSGTQLTQHAAVTLEDAVQEHVCLDSLDVSKNPIGESGLRSILRLAMMPTSNLKDIRISEFRDDANNPELVFNYGDLVEDYRGDKQINCAMPYCRSVMRLILRRVDHFKTTPSEALQNFRMNKQKVSPPFTKEDSRWTIPTTGIAEFDLVLDPINAQVSNPGELVQMWQANRRLAVGLKKFANLMPLWRQLRTETERRIFIDAAAKDLLFKVAQLKFFAQELSDSSPGLVPDMVARFAIALGDVGRTALNSALKSCGKKKGSGGSAITQQKALTQLRSLATFNPENPTGRYSLSLEDPIAFTTAERLLMIDHWASGIARKKGYLDTGEAGHWRGLRNCSMDGSYFRFKATWMLPGDGFTGSGTLEFDYLTPLQRPVAGKDGVTLLSDEQFPELLALMDTKNPSSDATEESRLVALYTSSHRFWFTAAQVRALLKVLSHYKRVETYVKLFPRCVEFGAPLNDIYDGVLFDADVFDENDRFQITERISQPNTMDGLAIHVEPHSFHCFDLTKRDQHIAAQYILKMADLEPGENMGETSWSSWRSRGPGVWYVPSGWLEDLPTHGIWRVQYKCQELKPPFLNIPKRKEQLKEYFGWVSFAVPQKAGAGNKRGSVAGNKRGSVAGNKRGSVV